MRGLPPHVPGVETMRTRSAAGAGVSGPEAPVVVGDRVALPRGTSFHGHVVTSKSSGRLKGRAVLGPALDGFELAGVHYTIDTSSNARVSRGHKKRNWGFSAGGAGLGAAIGALAGGGRGGAHRCRSRIGTPAKNLGT